MERKSVTLLLCFVFLTGKSFGQFEDDLWDDSEKGHDDRPFSSKGPLTGRPDGHEPTEKPLIGRPDGHEPTEKPLFGRPDGHEPTEKPLIGRPDGHDFPEKFPEDEQIEEDLSELDLNEEVSEWVEDDDGNLPLVRCKRPMCSVYCENGFQTDSNGCPVCKCLQDPCQGVKCTDGLICQPVECSDSRSCVELSSQCIRPLRNCPEPMCANFCPNGYAHNDRGCMTCTCKTEESAPEESQGVRSPPCPEVMCAEFCASGYKKNEQGCSTCTCIEAFTEQSYCGGSFCDVGQVCESRNSKYYCAPKPLCRLAQEMAHMKRDNRRMNVMNLTKQFVPECESDGSFRLIQCHQLTEECWCVDDRGKEIAGSRATYNDEQLHCEPAVTALVRMHIELSCIKESSKDDATDEGKAKKKQDCTVDLSSAKSKYAIEDAFSSWLLMDKQSVVLTQVVLITESRISVELVLNKDDTVDLPSAVEFMKRKMRMDHCRLILKNVRAEDVYFVPNVDTLTPEYHYGSEQIVPAATKLDDPLKGCDNILLVVVALSLLLIIVTLLTVLLIRYRLRTKRSVQFRHHKLENQLSHEQKNFSSGEIAGEAAVILVSSTQPTKTQLLA